jgi:UDP-N-acetylglucosamine:LPS N-acetylglucosamine transferase
MKKHKILAAASSGGHLIQLLRLAPLFQLCDTMIVTNDYSDQFENMFSANFFITDVNQNSSKLAILYCSFQALIIILKSKPDIVISTGALP